MKRKRVALLVLWMLSVLIMTGCGKNKVTKNTYRDSGIEYLTAGNYIEALTSFDAALEFSKGKIGTFEKDVLKYRAEAEFLMEDYQKAADTYGILAEIDGSHSEYAYLENLSLALSFDEEGDFQTALSFYEAAMESGGANGDVYNRMGLCKMKEGSYEDAVICFQNGLSVATEENRGALLYNEAVAYEYLGDFETARAKLENYVASYGQDAILERELDFLKTR